MVWIALSAIWATWLIFILLYPDKWSHVVDKETNFWVKKGIIKTAFAEKCASFEKGKGMKTFLSIGLIGFVANVIIAYYPALFLFGYTREFYESKNLYATPQQLNIDEITPCKTNILFGGFFIGVPWEDIINIHTAKTDLARGYNFENNQRITLFQGTSNLSYQIEETILSTTPDDFTSMQSTDEVLRIGNLLTRKEICMLERSSCFYFSTPRFIGFQMLVLYLVL